MAKKVVKSKKDREKRKKNLKSSEIVGKKPLSIIGIGTSAGGLEALESFFDACPSNTGMAFVIVQHLSPDYKSLMTELLSRHTEMQVSEALEQAVVEANQIYLIPGSKNITIKNGRLELTKRPKGAQMNFSIDIFFHSLAAEQKEKAIGIILSGTGSDGTRGGKSIKEVGGTVFVQSPESSKFDGMPRSAINHGIADYILPTSQMPSELIQFVSFPHYEKAITGVDVGKNLDAMDRILKILRDHTGYDFFSYKKPTLLRRTAKRMNITKSESVESYIEYIYDNPDEKFILVDEFLIGVTKFFRDIPAFQILENQVIPSIVNESQTKKKSIKIWVVACSTGEEAYSLAILLEEFLHKRGLKINYKIFATDIDGKSIDKAAKGVYSENIANDVSPTRLSKYFIRKDNGFQILPTIRRNIVFSKHDILQHPPFNKMDLVSCRNMMIYLDASIQGKVLASLHYALNLDGFLFMGSSENIGLLNKNFKEINSKWNIYKNIIPAKFVGLGNKKTWQVENRTHSFNRGSKVSNNLNESIIKATNKFLMDDLDVVSVSIDENFEILQASGKFKQYITIPEEGYSNNILKILPDGLTIPITTAVRKLLRGTEDRIVKMVKLIVDDQLKSLRVVIRLLNLGTANFNSFVITIVEKFEHTLDEADLLNKEQLVGVQSEEVNELKEALNETRENLQSTIEELETSNEEMQATNEELLASNEELQSTNEELQSLNEELHTVNAEMQEKNVQLLELNSDIENLMVNTNIGTIFLDRDFTIRKYTPAIKEHFQLISDDIGRSIEHFSGSLGGTNLVKHAKDVLKTLTPFKLEFQNKLGVWFLLQIHPYRNQADKIMGVIVNFINVNDLKESDKKNNEMDKYISHLTQSSPTLMYVYDLISKSNVFATKSILDFTGYSPEEIRQNGQEILMKSFHQEDLDKIAKHHKKLSKTKDDSIHQIEYRVIHKDSGNPTWLISSDKVHERDKNGKPLTILGVSQDITYVKEIEAKIKESEERAQLAIKSTNAGIWEWSDITQFTSWWSDEFYKLLGYKKGEIEASYTALLNIIHPDNIEQFQRRLENHVINREQFEVSLRILTKKNVYKWFRVNAQAQWNNKQEVQKIVGVLVDINKQMVYEQTIEEKRSRLEAIYEHEMVGIVLADKKGIVLEASKGVETILGYKRKYLLKKPMSKFIFKEDLATNIDLFNRIKKRNGIVEHVDQRYIHANKSLTWTDTSIAKLSILDEELFMWVILDIDRRKQAEEKMLKLNEELSRFVYLASHDLKEPLRTITSVTERFKDKYSNNLDPKANQYIEFIEDASSRMQDLTGELLTYSELGNKIKRFTSFSLNKLVKKVVEIDLANSIAESKAKIIINNLPTVKGDATQLKLLFQNLISNSIKYRKKTAPKITIDYIDKDGFWQFSVKDNGIGIKEEDQEKIFEVFRRLHGKNEYEGSGIGLANCKRIINNHNGSIWVRSKLNRGSTFYFTIPKKVNKKISR